MTVTPAFSNDTLLTPRLAISWSIVALFVGNVAAIIYCQQLLDTNVLNTPELLRNGAVISLTITMSALFQIGVLATAIQIRGVSFSEYIGLALPSKQQIIVSLVMLDIFVVLVEGSIYLLGGNLVPAFQIDVYQSAKAIMALPALFSALVLMAPIAEEIMFRGFLYRSLTQQPGKEIYAIIITTLAWSLLHVQYDLMGLMQVFAMGLFLGAVRWKTGSTGLTILMHVMLNFQAMTETVIKVDGLTLLKMMAL